MKAWNLVVGMVSLCTIGNYLSETAPTDKDAKKFNSDLCGNFTGNVTEDVNITSPGWPQNNYSNDLDCTITVKVPENKLVRLYFHDFYMEPSYECWLDRLEIWRLPPLGKPFLDGYFCGHQIPPIQLLDIDFELRLVSDRYDRFPGFSAILKYIDN